jgi:ABC-type transport system substrate-binding protein
MPMTSTKPRHWLIGLLALAMLAAACGGGDSESSGRDDTSVGAAEDLLEKAQAANDDEEIGTNTADAGGEGDQVGGITDVDEERIVEGGGITYGIDSEGTGFNTLDTIVPGSIRQMVPVVESLTQILANGEWAPLLAKDLVPNEDFTVWTIHLREGIVFHDGAVLDANAAKANLMAFKLSPNVGFVMSFVREYVVVDDLTVEVHMHKPWATFPHSLTAQAGWMVSPLTLGQNDHVVGTGAFELVEWRPGDGSSYVKFEDYWRADEGIPTLDWLEIKVIPESAARRAALEAGDIQAYAGPADSDLVDFLADDNVNVYQSGLGGNEFILMPNLSAAPLDDVRIRRALMHAIDRDLMIDTFRSGLTEKASSLFESTSRWYVETDYPDFDMAEAQRLVAEYEAENGPVSFTMTSSNRSATVEDVEFMISFWEEAGFEVELELIDPGSIVSRVITDNFQLMTWAQFGDADPDSAYVFFHSQGGANFLNWSNHSIPELDAAWDAGRATDDFDTRAAAYAEIQQILAEEVPLLWIDHLSGAEAVVSSSKIEGLNAARFPEGQEGAGVVNGSFHSYAGIFYVADSDG